LVRSLQRSLNRAGLSYSQLLAEARCRSASWWLMCSASPIAEIGYLCGYADQSHFTRDFRYRVGMTPVRYRTEFAPYAEADRYRRYGRLVHGGESSKVSVKQRPKTAHRTRDSLPQSCHRMA
jgi:AraC-like DNA-binding protein